MICLPGLINASELEKIGEFKLALREIALCKASLQAKIALASSLKETLKIALEGALKRAEIVKMEENVVFGSTSKLTLLSRKTNGSSCEK